jgi:conjugative transfer pilus assembly protein TraH
MPKLKLLPAVVTVVCLSAIPAYAGLSDALNYMMSSTNVTNPGAYSSATRGGYVGGSIEMRTPIKPINIVQIDPPNFSGGCGGIDLYGGSFSFINGQQIVDLFRKIMANAQGLLFKAALNSISPKISALVTEFQTAIQKLNSSMSNTCAIATQIIPKSFSSADIDTALGQTVSLIGSAAGTATDMFDAMTGSGSKAGQASDVAAATPTDSNMGNLTWKALSESQADLSLGDPTLAADPNPQESRELIMSILGTVIVQADPNAVNGTAGAPASMSAPYYGQIGLMDLKAGTGGTDDLPPLNVFHCGDATGSGLVPASGCLTMVTNTPSSFIGTDNYAKMALYGTNSTTNDGDASNIQPGSIIDRLINCSSANCGMTSQQQAFLLSIPAPIFNLIRDAQVDKHSIPQLMKTIEPMVSTALLVNIADSVFKTVKKTWTGVHSAAMPQLITDKLTELSSERASLRQMELAQSQLLVNANEYVKNVIKKNPAVLAINR